MGIFDQYGPAVVNTLRQRGMSGDCPMCKKNDWVIQEAPVSMPVYEIRGDQEGKVVSGGTTMPMAAMICKNCGFASFHSLGALGLIRTNKPGENPQNAPIAPVTETPSEPAKS